MKPVHAMLYAILLFGSASYAGKGRSYPEARHKGPSLEILRELEGAAEDSEDSDDDEVKYAPPPLMVLVIIHGIGATIVQSRDLLWYRLKADLL
jgi:hypothetical protein